MRFFSDNFFKTRLLGRGLNFKISEERFFFPNTTFSHFCSLPDGNASATRHSAIAVTPLSRYYKNKPHITE